MTANIQRAMVDIEARAADFFTAIPQASEELADSSGNPPPMTATAEAQSVAPPEPPNEPPAVLPSGEKSTIENDPFFAAGRQVLRELAIRKQTVLLLLSETPLSATTPGGIWSTIFADVANDPVLAVGIDQQLLANKLENAETMALTQTAAEVMRSQIVQSRHPGLCTSQAMSNALCGTESEAWWATLRSQFGVILIDGSGQDATTRRQLIANCSNVLFVVEYGKTSRIWATQVRKEVASCDLVPLGCVAQS